MALYIQLMPRQPSHQEMGPGSARISSWAHGHAVNTLIRFHDGLPVGAEPAEEGYERHSKKKSKLRPVPLFVHSPLSRKVNHSTHPIPKIIFLSSLFHPTKGGTPAPR